MNKDAIISGATLLAGLTLSSLAKKGWQVIFSEEPPTVHTSEEINWKKVIAWSFVTGTVISSAKLAVSRYATLKLKD